VFAQLLGNDLESGQSALSQIMLKALEALIAETGYVCVQWRCQRMEKLHLRIAGTSNLCGFEYGGV
jgi:hypothetical protein